MVELLAGVQLGHRDEEIAVGVVEEVAQRDAAQDLLVLQVAEDVEARQRPQDEFVITPAAERRSTPDSLQFLPQIGSFLHTLRGTSRSPSFPSGRYILAARAISASLMQMFGLAFAPADMLLTRRQRQHVGALSVDIHGLADRTFGCGASGPRARP